MEKYVELNLFNAADANFEYFLVQDDFDRSLLFNILFQDRILLHEAYFFTSGFLAKHIKDSKHSTSLFEVAAKNGIIVPAFREKNIRTLEDCYKGMPQVYGKNHKIINDNLDTASLYRLYHAVNIGSEKSEPFYWPEGVMLGESYYDIAKRYLQREELPEYIKIDSERYKVLNKYWKATSKWRNEIIEIAAENTQKKGAYGLQKMEIVKLLANEIKVPYSDNTTDFHHLINHARQKETKKLVEVFTKWVTQLHHVNMARVFQTALNFPVYNTNEDFLVESITRTSEDNTILPNEGFDCTVKLPPIEIITKEDPTNLISIRNELGSSYLNALRVWQSNPNDYNLDKVQVLFSDYCSRICKWYAIHPTVNLKARYEAGKNLGKNGLDFINNVISSVIPIAGVFLAFGKLGYAIYEYHSDTKKYKTKNYKFEINVNEHHKQISN